jgi:hypothetical protein
MKILSCMGDRKSLHPPITNSTNNFGLARAATEVAHFLKYTKACMAPKQIRSRIRQAQPRMGSRLEEARIGRVASLAPLDWIDVEIAGICS